MTGLLRLGSCGGRWQQKAPEHLGDGLEARAGANSTHRDTANHCACFWTSTVNSGRSGSGGSTGNAVPQRWKVAASDCSSNADFVAIVARLCYQKTSSWR